MPTSSQTSHCQLNKHLDVTGCIQTMQLGALLHAYSTEQTYLVHVYVQQVEKKNNHT